ncbi:MAG: hybrid sensor histidine kinase/response regulator [Pseudomonadota bacterium]
MTLLAEPQGPRTAAVQHAPMQNRIRALVVEDDDDHFALLELLLDLEDPSISIHRARCLAEMDDLFHSARFDIVLLDLGLPESTGIDTLRAAIAHIEDCPILVLTSANDTELGLAAIQAGAADFVDKPSLSTSGLGRRIAFATERFDIQRKLRQRNEMLHTLVAILGHDLKSPPRQITLLCDMIDHALPKEARHCVADNLAAIRSRCAHLRRLLNDTTEYALNAAQDHVKRDRIRISDVVERVREDLDDQDRGRVTLAADAEITADAGLLFHILRNLIGNGLKYWRDIPSNVTVGAKTAAGQSSIWVTDTGIGIAPEMIDRVFEPTVRGVAKAEFSGTGFGLSIAKLLIERHGGQIAIKSDAGCGTDVVIHLPFTAELSPKSTPATRRN